MVRPTHPPTHPFTKSSTSFEPSLPPLPNQPPTHPPTHPPTYTVWAVGTILFCLLGGYNPFEGRSTVITIARIKAGKYSFPSPYFDHVSEDAKGKWVGGWVDRARRGGSNVLL